MIPTAKSSTSICCYWKLYTIWNTYFTCVACKNYTQELKPNNVKKYARYYRLLHTISIWYSIFYTNEWDLPTLWHPGLSQVSLQIIILKHIHNAAKKSTQNTIEYDVDFIFSEFKQNIWNILNIILRCALIKHKNFFITIF